MADQVTRFAGDIITSANDKRSYRYVTLNNQLRCLLVSDPTTEKSAACCDVHVGSLSDPQEAQGLAHFLEHMLFMGTEKYPGENEYSSYLNTHGGGSNAYTSTENTVYYFDVLSDAFEGALDLFSTFFTCPLFTESGTMREIQAVDSENSKNLQSDWWRKYQLMKSMARPDHALNSFSTGNLHTLHEVPTQQGTNIRDLMLQFYDKHYSANLMRLVVYGAQPLDVLEKWVADRFTAVPNKDIPRASFPRDPFTAQQLGKVVQYVPVRDLKTLELVFPIPAVEDLYLTKPNKYFGHLIGHESEGSILHALKAQRWADSLSCYVETSCRDFATYAIKVEMTAEGIAHVSEIVECIFAYIGMISRSGPQDWVWQELKEISEMSFRFLDKTQPQDYVVQLANGLQTFAPEHSVCGDMLVLEKDLAASVALLAHLRPDNALVMCAHKGLVAQATSTERWYGTQYNVHDVSAEDLQRWELSLQGGSGVWDSQLQFPVPNPFVPTDFTLQSEGSPDKYAQGPTLVFKKHVAGPGPLPAVPVVPLVPKPPRAPATTPEDADDEDDSEESEDDEPEASNDALQAQDWEPLHPATPSLLWHKDDSAHDWDVPKAVVYIYIDSLQCANMSAYHVALTDLLVACLEDVLNAYTYYADCAGFSFNVSTARGGICVYGQGYSDKLEVLLQKALEQCVLMCSPQAALSDGTFGRLHDKLLRQYKNSLFMQPYYHCIYGNYQCLEQPRWSAYEKYTAVRGVGLAGFLAFAQQWAMALKTEVLVTGNYSAAQAQGLEEMVQRTLRATPLPASMESTARCVALERGVDYVHVLSACTINPAEVNSAVENLYIVGAGASRKCLDDESIAREALSSLVAHIVSEPAFDVLRTKEQLGYIVYASKKRVAMNVLALSVVAQSSHKDATYLDSRVEAFLLAFRDELVAMSDETLQKHVQSVVEKLLEKPKNLNNETNTYRDELVNKTYLFDRKQRLVDTLRSTAVSRAAVVSFYESVLLPGAQRRKLSTQYFGKHCAVPGPEGRPEVQVRDAAEFKRTMPLLPVLGLSV